MLTALIVSVAVLGLATVGMGCGMYKMYSDSKKQKNFMADAMDAFALKTDKQGQDIHSLELKTDDITSYNRAMAYLLLEDQKSYAYNVALSLESMMKKNEVLVQYSLLPAEIVKSGNYQLASLRGCLQQYGDSLGFVQQRLKELPASQQSAVA